jgi:hypothetical protein
MDPYKTPERGGVDVRDVRQVNEQGVFQRLSSREILEREEIVDHKRAAKLDDADIVTATGQRFDIDVLG